MVQWSDAEIRAAVRIRTVDDILALLERVTMDEMRLENSHARNRTVGVLCGVALKALEVGEFEVRLTQLEEAIENGKHT